MTVGGAFLGGSAGNDIPVGQCELIVQILTDNREGMAKTVTIANGSHSYSVTTGADGNGSVLVATDGGNYTVTIQGISGYLNASPQIVTPLSTEAVLVRFDLMRVSTIALAMYPVGSLFISVNSANPGTFLGGTWVQFAQGRTLLGVSGSHPVNQTGGSETVTLNANQMPAHNHGGGDHTHGGSALDGGSHQHSIKGYFPSSSSVTSRVAGTGTTTESGNNPATEGGGNHTHALSINGSGAIIASNGGGQAHNNMMPFIATYIWKRTA